MLVFTLHTSLNAQCPSPEGYYTIEITENSYNDYTGVVTLHGYQGSLISGHTVSIPYDDDLVNIISVYGAYEGNASYNSSLIYIAAFGSHYITSNDRILFYFDFEFLVPEECYTFSITSAYIDGCNPVYTSAEDDECVDGRTIGGSITTISGQALCESSSNYGFPQAEVEVEGNNYAYTDETANSGAYSDYGFKYEEYTATPDISESIVELDCGVGPSDIDVIRAHILGTANFQYVYQHEAADANNNNNVSTLDLVMITRMYLYGDIYAAGSWEFVTTTSYITADPTVYELDPPLENSRTIPSNSYNYPNNNFYAIKVGDLDGTCYNDCFSNRARKDVSEDFILSYEEDGIEIKSVNDISAATGIIFDLNHRGSLGEKDFIFPIAKDRDLILSDSNDDRNRTFFYWGLGDNRKVDIAAGETILKINQKYIDQDLSLTLYKSSIETEDVTIHVNNVEYKTRRQNDEFMVYPNPTHDVIYIKDVANINVVDEINLYEVSGRELLIRGNGTSSIDVSQLREGIYILRILSEDKIYSYKVHILR